MIVGTAMLTIGATSISAFAASTYRSPAEIVAGLTDKTVETVTQEKTETGKTYGALANENGVLDEFKSEMLEQKKNRLNEKVAEGTMTQERSDTILAAIEENQANCDGSGNGRGATGERLGAGFGAGNGAGNGSGAGKGTGTGTGRMNGNQQNKGNGLNCNLT